MEAELADEDGAADGLVEMLREEWEESADGISFTASKDAGTSEMRLRSLLARDEAKDSGRGAVLDSASEFWKTFAASGAKLTLFAMDDLALFLKGATARAESVGDSDNAEDNLFGVVERADGSAERTF